MKTIDHRDWKEVEVTGDPTYIRKLAELKWNFANGLIQVIVKKWSDIDFMELGDIDFK